MMPVNPDTIVRNKHFQSDLKYDLELNRILLKMIGVWPTNSKQSTNFDKIVDTITKIISILFIIFYVVPLVCQMFLIETDSTLRFRLVGPLSFCSVTIVKYVIILAKRESVEFCIDLISADWREVDSTICRPIMLKNATVCRIFTKICVITTFGGTVVFYTCILPFITEPYQRNGTRLRPCSFPSEFYVFDAQISPMYEIVFFGHAMSTAVICTVSCGISTLSVKLVMHACSRYQIVTTFLQNINDNYNNDVKCQEDTKQKLTNIIQRHFDALTFVPRVENVLNGICLVDLVESSINICLLEYYMLVEWENSETIGIVTYFILMMSVVSNIFVICYIGDYLAEQCRKVGDCGYMTNWWEFPNNQSRSLILIIAASQLPVKFTAGKMINLSLQTFGSVMKASLAYFNVLRRVM